MGLIEPGYLTGLYHPDRYFMTDYHPEFGMGSIIRGVPNISDQLVANPANTSRQLGSIPRVSICGRT